jgi:stage III sporulation protein SpoIIIAA
MSLFIRFKNEDSEIYKSEKNHELKRVIDQVIYSTWSLKSSLMKGFWFRSRTGLRLGIVYWAKEMAPTGSCKETAIPV